MAEIIDRLPDENELNAVEEVTEEELTAAEETIDCMECPYCKKKLSRAFYTTSALSYWYPSYCRRFKMQLPLTNPTSANRLRCQSKLPENAMREPLPQLTRWGFDPSRN